MFKDLHGLKKDLPDFSGSSRRSDGSVDMVFKCFSDAEKAKSILDSRIECVTKDPSPKSLKKYNLVGIPFEMDVNGVAEALAYENRHLFPLVYSNNVVSIKNDPSSCIHVHGVNKCKKEEVGYRITVSISANMMASIGPRKLSIGFTKCRLYEWTYHKCCYNCGEHGHYKAQCKNPVACLKCGGDHNTRDCTSKQFKCVNCVKSNKDNVDHPAYSAKCPYNH